MFGEPFFAVQLEQVDGSMPFRSQADNPFLFISEVLRLDLCPRVEQGAESSGLRVEGGEICSLVPVAAPAGERQVTMPVVPPCFSAIT